MGWIFLGAAALAQTSFAEDIVRGTPRLIWDQSMQQLNQAAGLVRQRRLTEALGLLARSRAGLQSLRKIWPHYRRLQVSREIHDVVQAKAKIYNLVEDRGLVEYHGKFYTFQQIQQFLEFQQQRSVRWTELLKAQEEVRRVKTERMVKDESKRPAQSPPKQSLPRQQPKQKRSES